MSVGIRLSKKIWIVGLLCCIISVGFPTSTMAHSGAKSVCNNWIEEGQIILNSHSFNAQKRSTFNIAGQKEHVERGLTIIHFNSPEKYEFRTFDTYSSEEASQKVVDVLWRMQKNGAVFVVLAHDSAAHIFLKQSETLKKLGFSKLMELKNRQAYIMHNFNNKIYERVDENSITLDLRIPENVIDNQIYFPRIRYKFTPNNNRYIAHAGGEVNGIKSTNSKDALDQSYAKGFRLFELDIIETADGKLVAAHDWKMWARFTDYSGELPPSHEEFKKHRIYGDYETLDLKGINEWFSDHPDATLVTDKIKDPVGFANLFIDKSRLIMELFSVMAVEKALNNGITAMISQEPLLKLVGDKLNYLEVNNIKYVALSRRIIANHTKLMLQLKEKGIKVYVYNVNFDPGKDEKYVQENEIGLVYGMYADKWVFDLEDKKLSK
ncbi:MAG: hypothetical protein KJO52_12540 [Maribacter sp.]|nr:hypothetical protein [Maribacter sp.]